MPPKTAPPLNAPASTTTVNVSAIDSTLRLTGVPNSMIWKPPIPGFDTFCCTTWSLLIEHPSGRKLLYDLGCRKDWQNLSPAIGLNDLVANGTLSRLEVEKNVADILAEGGLDLTKIEAVVWSHFHFDHNGDMSTFPATTKLIVGPGSKDAFMPGFPSDPKAHTLESDFAGREVMEINFDASDLRIGRFRAWDYFGDGSFYILDAPGHAIGHLNALARTHPSPQPAFIHLAGDSVHHAAEFRPTEYLPLPEGISPSPLPDLYPTACPGHVFAPVLAGGSTTEHILTFVDPWAGMVEQKFANVYDQVVKDETVRKVEELDAEQDVFSVFAHDEFLKGEIPEWPKTLNEWRQKGWKERIHWRFLADFKAACS